MLPAYLTISRIIWTISQHKTSRDYFISKKGGLTDTKTPYIAFGNQASMDDFAKRAHIHNDASRYRLNIMIDGLDAFAEMDLIGHYSPYRHS